MATSDIVQDFLKSALRFNDPETEKTLDAALGQLKASTIEKIDGCKSRIEDRWDRTRDRLEKRIDALQQELDHAELNPPVDANGAPLYAGGDPRVARLKARLATALEDLEFERTSYQTSANAMQAATR